MAKVLRCRDVGFDCDGVVSAEEAEKAPEREFIGAAKCKMCHNSTKQGKIYAGWLETAHAKAYETLASEASKKIAAEKGIEDPQKAASVLTRLRSTREDCSKGIALDQPHREERLATVENSSGVNRHDSRVL